MIAKNSSHAQQIIDVFSISKFGPRCDCPKGDIDCISKIRREEELVNCRSVEAKVEFLSFSDAELRGYPPDFNEFATLDFDKTLQDKIREEIKVKLVGAESVFFPLAIGRHVDHIIISKIGLELSVKENLIEKAFFYEDLPYSARKDSKYSLIDLEIDRKKIESHLIPISWRAKWNLCKTYRSQFSNKTYRRIMKYAKDIKFFGPFYERVWQISDIDYAREILTRTDLRE